MTRETAKSKIRMSVVVNKDHIKSLEKSDELIDQIYNDYETAIEILMKANEEEISRHFNELKAKDKITQDIKEAYELKSIAYDLLLDAIKLKDEEIKMLECRAYHAEGYINDLHNNPKDKKFYDKKARSIVAMLFGEWRKYNSNFKNEENSFIQGRASKTKELFYKAHKMLKEKQ